MPVGFYIHIPFCLRKCKYCDFFSVEYDEERMNSYVGAVKRNLHRYSACSADSVYFGGGTPSLLSAGMVCDILSEIDLAEGCEVTAECNPSSAGKDKFRGYLDAGINRLSVGIQSLNDRELKASGRLHNSNEAINTIKSAYSAGFENISADIMLGMPYQTISSLKETLDRILSLPLTHISAYMLTVAEDTPLASDNVLLAASADADTLADMYMLTCEKLEKAGFSHYEVSNFAAEGYECRHNLKYWRCEPYIGIGTAAHSCYNGKRFYVDNDIDSFINNSEQNEIVSDEAPCDEDERIMLALRLKSGIRAAELHDVLMKKAGSFAEAGFLEIKDGILSLTDKGFLISNEIICQLTMNS